MTGRIPKQERAILDHPLTVALIAGSAFGLLGFVTGQGTQAEKVAQLERNDVRQDVEIKELRTVVQQQAVTIATTTARIVTGG